MYTGGPHAHCHVSAASGLFALQDLTAACTGAGGGGKGGWGSVEDDIKEATKGGGVPAFNDTKVDAKIQED